MTSNPTIFASALAKGDAYDQQIHDLGIRGVSVDEAVRSITTYDIRWAADVLKPAYDQSDHQDGRVSLEVDPRLAHETEKSVAEARALWWLVDRPNMYIKIPATLEGLPAITAAIAEGISVNVTLIFSLERYNAVIDAYVEGLEKADAAGHDLSHIASVASFFVSRVDTEVDQRLDKIGTDEAKALKGTAAIANARLAYELYEQRIDTDRWRALAAKGRPGAAPAVGVHQHQGPVVPGHHVRDRAGGQGHGEHHAGGDPARGGRPRRDPRRHHPRHLRQFP